MAKRTCSVDGCERPHSSLGWCAMHGLRYRTHGEVGDAAPIRRWSPAELGRDRIPLTRGEIAMVDEEDYDRIMAVGLWFVSTKKGRLKYARHNRPGRRRGEPIISIAMHRFILDAPEDMEVDHRNGDGLDNRRSNLRLATRTENNWNSRSRGGTSKYKGVSWSKSHGLWQARIGKHSIGFFDDEEAAARARDVEAREAHGEFAWLNFPSEA